LANDPIQEGQELMLGGDYAAAQEIFLALLRDDPHDDNAWYHLGLCHLGAENLPEAEDCLRRCLELNPRHIDALIELGEVEFAGNQPEQAMLTFSKATAQDPQNARAWVAVARIHEMLGMDEEAVANYERAMMLSDPADAPSYDLALAYARVGKLLRADIIMDGLISDTLRQGTQNFVADLAPGARDDLMEYLAEMKQDRDEIRADYLERHGFAIDTARFMYQIRLITAESTDEQRQAALRELRLLRLMGSDPEGKPAVHRLHTLEGHFSGQQLAAFEYALSRQLGQESEWRTACFDEVWSEVESLF
jgi:tetratricopeptide (TPR) repeat protein